MKEVHLLSMALMVCLCFGCAKQEHRPPVTIDLADYGISEDQDATPLIIQALQDAQIKNADLIIIPKGRYQLSNERALEKYLAMSNNDNSLNRMVFSIQDFDGLTIDGKGSEFVFDGEIVPFVLEHSKNITLRNFSIDWKKPFYGQGTVVAKNESDRTFDVGIDGEFEYEIHHNRIYFNTTRGFHKTEQNLFWYPNGGGTVHNVNAYKLDPWAKWPNDSYEAEEIAPGLVRIKTLKNNLLPEPGWVWVVKGRNGERINPAVRIYRSENIYFQNVKIHHSGGMGIIGEKSKNISMDSLTVTPSPGSNRAISTSADATHFVNCQGTIRITNSYFSNMMDDATNVHGIYVRIKEVFDENRIGVEQVHSQQQGFDFAEPGDTLRIVDNKNLLEVGIALVKEYRWFNAGYQEIVFDRDVSKWVKEGFGIENISWVAGLHFENNVVEKNRARGIIFSTAGDVLVKGNKFNSMMAAISVSTDVNFWFESGAVKNVLIEDNHFVNCTTGGKGNSVVVVAPIVGRPDHEAGYLNEKFVVNANRFTAFDKSIFSALSVDRLQFTNNTITYYSDVPALYPDKSTFEFYACRDLLISGNTFNDFQKGSIEADSITMSSIILENNKNRTGKNTIMPLKGRDDIL